MVGPVQISRELWGFSQILFYPVPPEGSKSQIQFNCCSKDNVRRRDLPGSPRDNQKHWSCLQAILLATLGLESEVLALGLINLSCELRVTIQHLNIPVYMIYNIHHHYYLQSFSSPPICSQDPQITWNHHLLTFRTPHDRNLESTGAAYCSSSGPTRPCSQARLWLIMI